MALILVIIVPIMELAVLNDDLGEQDSNNGLVFVPTFNNVRDARRRNDSAETMSFDALAIARRRRSQAHPNRSRA